MKHENLISALSCAQKATSFLVRALVCEERDDEVGLRLSHCNNALNFLQDSQAFLQRWINS